MAALVFWAVFVQAFNEMMRLVLDGRLTGLMTGLSKMVDLAAEYALLMLDGTLIGVLLAGGFLVGAVAEAVERRFA